MPFKNNFEASVKNNSYYYFCNKKYNLNSNFMYTKFT